MGLWQRLLWSVNVIREEYLLPHKGVASTRVAIPQWFVEESRRRIVFFGKTLAEFVATHLRYASAEVVDCWDLDELRTAIILIAATGCVGVSLHIGT